MAVFHHPVILCLASCRCRAGAESCATRAIRSSWCWRSQLGRQCSNLHETFEASKFAGFFEFRLNIPGFLGVSCSNIPIKYSWTTHPGIRNLPCLLSLRLEAVLPLHVYVQRFWDLYVFRAAEKNLDRKLIEFLSLISPDTSGIYMASKCLQLIVLDPLSCPTPSPKKIHLLSA